MEANRVVVDEAIRQRVRECLDTSIKQGNPFPSANTHSAAQLEATIYSKSHTLEQYKNLAKNFIEHVRKKASGIASARAAASAMPTSNTLPATSEVPEPTMMSQGPGISQLHQRLTGNRMQGPNVAVGVGPVGVPMGVAAAGGMMQQGAMAGQRPMQMNTMNRLGGPNPMMMQQAQQPQAHPVGMMGMTGPGMGAGLAMAPRPPPPMYMPVQHLTTPGNSPAMMAQQSPASTNQYISHSPGMPQQHGIPSPAGPRAMVPSPLAMANANTPQSDQAASQEEQQYLEKVRQLSKYIEPLRRMIARIGNEDQAKLEKMKKLMDILSNPNKRMPMDTLKKCEAVLTRMNFDSDGSTAGGGGGSATTTESKYPLLEAIFNMKASGKASDGLLINHALQRCFGAPLEAVCGSEIALPPLAKSRKRRLDEDDEVEEDALGVLRREIRQLQAHFRVDIQSEARSRPRQPRQLSCHLEADTLPSVPPITVKIPSDYPERSPQCDAQLAEDYHTTPFLKSVQTALSSRLGKMPPRFTLSQLLNAWEMSVRSACSPRQVQATQMALLMGL